MLKKIILYKNLLDTYTLAYNQDNVLEYFLIDQDNSLIEAIFNCKVSQINNKNQVAFINYAKDMFGMVNLNKSQRVQNGSNLICQMTWGGDKLKLAKFSTEIKLIGRYVILLDEAVPQHYFAKDLLNKSKLNLFSHKYINHSIIFRSAINFVGNLNVVEDELEYLIKQQQLVQQSRLSGNDVRQLTTGATKYLQLLRSSRYTEDLIITTNDSEIFTQINHYLNLWQINQLELDINLTVNIVEMSSQLNLEAIANSTANLVIHKLAGINLIDVNSHNLNLTFYMVNYLAIDEIAKQVKLRDLTGIILIDFIKNMSAKEQDSLIDKLQKIFYEDFRKTKILGFTRSGILELIRSK